MEDRQQSQQPLYGAVLPISALWHLPATVLEAMMLSKVPQKKTLALLT